MNHHTAMRQGRTLSLLTRHQQHSSHRCSHTGTDGSYIAGDKLHGIINTQTCSDTTSRTVEIDRNILSTIYRVQIKQLCLKRIGCIIINLSTKEDDTVHHQT